MESSIHLLRITCKTGWLEVQVVSISSGSTFLQLYLHSLSLLQILVTRINLPKPIWLVIKILIFVRRSHECKKCCSHSTFVWKRVSNGYDSIQNLRIRFLLIIYGKIPSNIVLVEFKITVTTENLDNQSLCRHRRQRSVGNTFQPLREGSLFEYFLYVGVPSASELGNIRLNQIFAKIIIIELRIYCTTTNIVSVSWWTRSSPFEVISFCFPGMFHSWLMMMSPAILTCLLSNYLEGILQKNNVRLTDSQSDINRILFGSLSQLEKSSNSFVFLVTKDTDVFYGICVRQEELLEVSNAFIHFSFQFSLYSNCHWLKIRIAQVFWKQNKPIRAKFHKIQRLRNYRNQRITL